MTELVPAAPNSWTDGSRDCIDHLDVEIAGSGALIDSPSVVFDNHSWGQSRGLEGSDESSSRSFASVPAPC